MLNWKRRTRRQLFVALLAGLTVNAIYFGLEFTTALNGFAVGALGPAIDLVCHHLDPSCYARSYCDLEVFAANVVLYAFWIFLILIAFDLVRHLQRKREG